VAISTAGGALAGALTTFIVYPLDVARTRMASDFAAQGQAREHRGIAHCLRHVYDRGGVRSLYQGISASLVGVAVYR